MFSSRSSPATQQGFLEDSFNYEAARMELLFINQTRQKHFHKPSYHLWKVGVERIARTAPLFTTFTFCELPSRG